MSGVKEGLSAPLSTKTGLGAFTLVDGIIVLIVAIVDIVCKHTIGDMGVAASGFVVIVMSLLLIITGYFLLKDIGAGNILSWICAVLTLVYGVVMTFGIIKNNMLFDLYYLLTGAIMLYYVMKINLSKNKVAKH